MDDLVFGICSECICFDVEYWKDEQDEVDDLVFEIWKFPAVNAVTKYEKACANCSAEYGLLLDSRLLLYIFLESPCS